MLMKLTEMPSGALLNALGKHNLLPAIVFLPTRRRCDQAATEAALMRRDFSEARRDARQVALKAFIEKHPEVRHHRHRETITRGAVASHHAGHIPAWKLLIEQLMSAGLLDAIFATTTVAAGVDFPARTVVLTVADTRRSSGWRPLSASEFQQMTGRAGRRSRDNVGFIVAAPGLHQNPAKIAELLKAKPDPLISQFRATYSTLLNLLDAFKSFDYIREIVEKSFAFRDTARRIEQIRKEISSGNAKRVKPGRKPPEKKIESLRSRIWEPFQQRARVLEHFGYIDIASEKVTERGRWLADLHVEWPLLIGEALDKGLFASLDLPQTVGLMAALAADSEREYGGLEIDDTLVTALSKFDEVAFTVATEEWKHGIDPAPEVNFSAAATASRWAQGVNWLDLVHETRAEEGDLVRMLSRTGEQLLQVAGLKHAHREAATRAAQAAEVILRDPVR